MTRFVLTMLLLPAFTIALWAQQNITPTLQPSMEYDVTITTTVGGNDGMDDIAPSSSTQRLLLRTGAREGDAVPGRLTVYTTQHSAAASNERVEWEFTFRLTANGVLEEVATVSSQESMDGELAAGFLGRELEVLLFPDTFAARRGAQQPTFRIDKAAKRDGVGELFDVTYTMDFPESTEGRGAPMFRSGSGFGVYDGGLAIFTTRTQKEESRIYVAGDNLGPEKQVTMRRETVIETKVRPAR
jgi:hypothetical protein